MNEKKFFFLLIAGTAVGTVGTFDPHSCPLAPHTKCRLDHTLLCSIDVRLVHHTVEFEQP